MRQVFNAGLACWRPMGIDFESKSPEPTWHPGDLFSYKVMAYDFRKSSNTLLLMRNCEPIFLALSEPSVTICMISASATLR